jgi:hypothetical protein
MEPRLGRGPEDQKLEKVVLLKTEDLLVKFLESKQRRCAPL